MGRKAGQVVIVGALNGAGAFSTPPRQLGRLSVPRDFLRNPFGEDPQQSHRCRAVERFPLRIQRIDASADAMRSIVDRHRTSADQERLAAIAHGVEAEHLRAAFVADAFQRNQDLADRVPSVEHVLGDGELAALDGLLPDWNRNRRLPRPPADAGAAGGEHDQPRQGDRARGTREATINQ
jgi:hypothetical protein